MDAYSRSLTITHETVVNGPQVAFRRASNYDETGWRRAWHVKGREIFGRNYFCPQIRALQIGDDGVLVRALSTMLEIQAPLPVAQLPRPLDADGKTLFNSVYGVSTLRKVKRHEIVAAVDGEAVNIYDVNFEPSGALPGLRR